MGSVNRVYLARLCGCRCWDRSASFGRVRDVVIASALSANKSRVLGLVVDGDPPHKDKPIPILVAAIEPHAAHWSTGNVTAIVEQRPGEYSGAGSVLDTLVKVNDPALSELAGVDVVVTDLGVEQTRSRDWMVTRSPVRTQRRLRRRTQCTSWTGTTWRGWDAVGLGDAGSRRGTAARPVRGDGKRSTWPTPSARRRHEVQGAPRQALGRRPAARTGSAEVLSQLGTERAADVGGWIPIDAADLPLRS